MKKETENLIKSYRELFALTGSPVFGATLLYMQRTGKTITLGGLGLGKEDEHNLSL